MGARGVHETAVLAARLRAKRLGASEFGYQKAQGGEKGLRLYGV